MIGDAGTGKTHLIYCYTKEKVPSNVIVPTVGAEFASKLVNIDNKTTLKAQIWDTTGQEAYRAVTMRYCRLDAAFIINLLAHSWYSTSRGDHHTIIFRCGLIASGIGRVRISKSG